MSSRGSGHFGTTPGLNLIYVHLNRAIRARDLNAIYVAGLGHGGPAVVANAYLEGTYTELYPHVTQDEAGLASSSASSPSQAAFRATPRPRHQARSTKAASRVRARTRICAAFDNPDLLVACVVGDGEAETGPLATSWHSNKF